MSDRTFRTATFLLGLLILFAALDLDVFGVDSTQYAWLSFEMFQTGEYLQVKQFGNDYLDKPPLLFWLSSAGFHLLGVHNWSFRLVSVLVSFGLGLFSTYHLARNLYNRRVAIRATIILGTSLAWWLFNIDLRTDAVFAGFLIFSVWQLHSYLQDNRPLNFLLAFAGIGLSMLAKGPLGLMIPVLAFAPYLVLEKRTRDLFRWQWLVGLAVILAVLSPMMWGLYRQFDLHPEKTIRFFNDQGYVDKQGVSGLRFFFWTQSFGRITGENVWSNSAGWDFFLHTYLWAFLPWSISGLGALWSRIRGFFRRTEKESLTFFAFVLPFLALSASAYKLPHYIFPLFPFLAILTAAWLEEDTRFKRVMWKIHLGVLLIPAGLSFFLLWAFPAGWWKWALVIALVILATRELILRPRTIRATVLVALLTFSVLFLHFYPNLLVYQNEAQLAHKARELGLKPEQGALYGASSFAFPFYMQGIVRPARLNQLLDPESGITWVYTNKKGLGQLVKELGDVEILALNFGTSVTNLSPSFLLPESRNKELEVNYLVRLKKEK